MHKNAPDATVPNRAGDAPRPSLSRLLLKLVGVSAVAAAGALAVLVPARMDKRQVGWTRVRYVNMPDEVKEGESTAAIMLSWYDDHTGLPPEGPFIDQDSPAAFRRRRPPTRREKFDMIKRRKAAVDQGNEIWY